MNPIAPALADEEIAEALAQGQEVLPINLEPTLVDLLDVGVRRLEEKPTWKVGLRTSGAYREVSVSRD